MKAKQPEKPDSKSKVTRLFEQGLFLFTGEELKMRESYAAPTAVKYDGQAKAKHYEPASLNTDQASFMDRLLKRGPDVEKALRATYTVHATQLS